VVKRVSDNERRLLSKTAPRILGTPSVLVLPHGLLERLGTIALPLLYQVRPKPCPAPRKCSMSTVRVYRIIRILQVMSCPKDIVIS
jgi:hypothetical protein